jgi:hypothetical protein
MPFGDVCPERGDCPHPFRPFYISSAISSLLAIRLPDRMSLPIAPSELAV